MHPGERFLRVLGSPEIYLKSRSTRERFVRLLVDNVRAALSGSGIETTTARTGIQELRVDAPDLEAAAAVVATVFGVGRIEVVEAHPFEELADLASTVAAIARPRITGKQFAVRVKRHGVDGWSSKQAEQAIGSLLLEDSAGVDLGNPEVVVRVHAEPGRVLIVSDEPTAPNGLPIGAQEPVLAMLSGGIDSPVAAWMMMRTGCPVDFVHLEMECSVTDQALAVAHGLVRGWGHGSEPRFHVADFQPVKQTLVDNVDPRFRQVVLKQLMLLTAERVAADRSIPLLVTGESLGQVSSQTAAHLAELDRTVEVPVIRPLVALRKEEIIERARRIGTYDLSVRTREVCDLSDGARVATRATADTLARAARDLPDDLVERAVESLRTVEARRWSPGMTIEPAA